MMRGEPRRLFKVDLSESGGGGRLHDLMKNGADPSQQRSRALQRLDSIGEGGWFGRLRDRLHLCGFTGHAFVEGEPIMFLPDPIEGRRLKRQRAWLEERIAQDESRMQRERMPMRILTLSVFACVFTIATLTAQGDVPAPPDVKAPPAKAQKTASGLASMVIKNGTGKNHPGATDMVTVNYTGWTTDGKMFDSSRGQPVSFPLNKVIKGWTEGLQLMVEGETRRFWIPEPLAYGGRRAPYGMLVFDVELISFTKG
jgi:hypothetical protein